MRHSRSCRNSTPRYARETHMHAGCARQSPAANGSLPSRSGRLRRNPLTHYSSPSLCGSVRCCVRACLLVRAVSAAEARRSQRREWSALLHVSSEGEFARTSERTVASLRGTGVRHARNHALRALLPQPMLLLSAKEQISLNAAARSENRQATAASTGCSPSIPCCLSPHAHASSITSLALSCTFPPSAIIVFPLACSISSHSLRPSAYHPCHSSLRCRSRPCSFFFVRCGATKLVFFFTIHSAF